MFYAYIPLFSYMGANLGQMPAAAAIAAAAKIFSRRSGYGHFSVKILKESSKQKNKNL